MNTGSSAFRCVPIDAAVADRFRRTGIDDGGNAMRRMVADRRVTDGPSFPCRQCLRNASDGDAMLLGSYNLPQPRGIYWTPSPIFLHAHDCEPFAQVNEIAQTVRNSLVSVRAYDDADQCLYDLGHVALGEIIDDALSRAIGDPRTQFVNIHTAKPGCLLCRVERM